MPATMNLTGLNVVVVDDQEDARLLISYILESSGAMVKQYESADEALEAVMESPPDVIVSDIRMPQHDGYWLIEQVRQLSPDQGGLTPAVAVTARTLPEEKKRAMNAGFQMHIGKPFEPEQVLNAVERLTKPGSDHKD